MTNERVAGILANMYRWYQATADKPHQQYVLDREAVKQIADALSIEPTRDDPLAGVRWICSNCGTCNGIDDPSCLGCRKPRQEHDSRVNRTGES